MDGGNFDERLWMDKYQPKRVEDLEYNHNVTEIIKTIAQKEDFPHLIFYGPEGAGKKTRIRALLSLLYGSGVNKVTTESKELKVNSTTVEYLVTSSNYHIELNPSDSEYHDRLIIQKVIKETASVSQLDVKNQRSFKIIVIQEADNLSKEAQAGLRRTMEKYMQNCRLIMSCNSITRMIPPIRSRCLSIRVPCPSEEDIRKILKNIVVKEAVSVNDKQIDLIIKSCERNVRRAINSLQLTSLETYSKEIFVPEYLLSIRNISSTIMKEQSASSLRSIRDLLMKLIVNGLTAELIIMLIVKEMSNMIKNEEKKLNVVNWAAFYSNRLD